MRRLNSFGVRGPVTALARGGPAPRGAEFGLSALKGTSDARSQRTKAATGRAHSKELTVLYKGRIAVGLQ